MKTITILFTITICLLSNLYAGGGEIIIINKLPDTVVTVTVLNKASEYQWSENESGEVYRLTSLFDTSKVLNPYGELWLHSPSDPAGIDEPGATIPWGIYNIKFSIGGQDKYNVTLDLRDHAWSNRTNKYLNTGVGSVDTKIEIFYTLTGVRRVRSILPVPFDSTAYDTLDSGSTYTIWSIWDVGNPSQNEFQVPVKVSNKVEGLGDFGTLLVNSESVSSGSTPSIRNHYGSVMEETPDKTVGNDLFDSFIWNHFQVNPVASADPYSNQTTFITDINYNNDRAVEREFKKVHTLTVQNYSSEISQSIGYVEFKDPTTTNQFEDKDASGSGYVNERAFHELEEDIGGLLDQRYALKAKPTISYGGNTYQYSSGNFDENGIDILLTSDALYKANYKGINISNNSNAYGYSNQKRFYKSPLGKLCNVYESMGKIWLEVSDNDGSTWEIANDGKPLSNEDAKQPSIAYWGTNNIMIVFQEDAGATNTFNLRIVNYNLLGERIDDSHLFPTIVSSDYDLVDATPVIANSNSSDWHTLIAFRKSSGIGYFYIKKNGVTSVTELSSGTMSNSNSSSYYPAVVAKDLGGSGTPTFHIAWQQGSPSGSIKHQIATGSGSSVSFGTYSEASAGGYANNLKPSIAIYNNLHPIVAWVRYNPITYANEGVFRVKGSTVWGSFFAYQPGGDEVDLTNVNNASGTNFVLGMKLYNEANKYVKSTASGTVLNLASIGDLQVSNGSNMSDIRIMSLEDNSLPYDFQFSGAGGLSKGTEKQIVERQIAILNEGKEVYTINMGGIEADNEQIEFEETPYDEVPNNSSAFFITESFNLKNNNKLYLDFGYDKKESEDLISSDINVDVSLVDASTNEPIASLIAENSNSFTSLKKTRYEVIPNFDKGKEVKLVMNLQSDDELQYVYTQNVLFEGEGGGSVEKETNTEVITLEDEIPVTYNLDQNYPNPFNPSTTISYSVPTRGLTKLVVFDILGREITTLVNEVKQPGKHTVQFDANGLASGFYIYKLVSGDFVESKKMLLLK